MRGLQPLSPPYLEGRRCCQLDAEVRFGGSKMAHQGPPVTRDGPYRTTCASWSSAFRSRLKQPQLLSVCRHKRAVTKTPAPEELKRKRQAAPITLSPYVTPILRHPLASIGQLKSLRLCVLFDVQIVAGRDTNCGNLITQRSLSG